MPRCARRWAAPGCRPAARRERARRRREMYGLSGPRRSHPPRALAEATAPRRQGAARHRAQGRRAARGLLELPRPGGAAGEAEHAERPSELVRVSLRPSAQCRVEIATEQSRDGPLHRSDPSEDLLAAPLPDGRGESREVGPPFLGGQVHPRISATWRERLIGSKGLESTAAAPSWPNLALSAACTLAVKKITGISRVAGSPWSLERVLALQGLLERGKQRVVVERLLQPADDVAFGRVRLGLGQHAQDHDRHALGAGALGRCARRLPSAHARHHQVQDDHVRALGCRELDGLLVRGRSQRAVATVLHHRAHDLEHVRIVVAHQDRRGPPIHGHCARGVGCGASRQREGERTALPEPGVDPDPSAVLLHDAAADRQIGRPRPVPPFSRESEASTCPKRSKMESSLSAGMPRPPSRTAKSASPLRRSQVICTASPGSVPPAGAERWRSGPDQHARCADPGCRRGDVPCQGARRSPLRDLRRRDAVPLGGADARRERAAWRY